MWRFSKNTLKSVTTYKGSIESVPRCWSCPKLQSEIGKGPPSRVLQSFQVSSLVGTLHTAITHGIIVPELRSLIC